MMFESALAQQFRGLEASVPRNTDAWENPTKRLHTAGVTGSIPVSPTIHKADQSLTCSHSPGRGKIDNLGLGTCRVHTSSPCDSVEALGHRIQVVIEERSGSSRLLRPGNVARTRSMRGFSRVCRSAVIRM
jgi:hypothetical protein